jgi:hypothetical protein
VVETSILAALPSTLARTCVRGGTLDDARLAGFTGRISRSGSSNYGWSTAQPYTITTNVTPYDSLGGVTCHPATGAARLFVMMPLKCPSGCPDVIAMGDEYLGYLTAYHHLPFGSCATDRRASEPWTSPSGSGNLACMNPYDGRPWIYFSFDKGQYLAFATRDDSDYAALYAWWEQLKTFLP